MRNFPTWTLCSKHWEIEWILTYIRDNSTEFDDEISKWIQLISDCLDDGNRMESKLKDRKKEVDELNDTISILEKQISNYESEIESLNEEIKSLESNY